MRRGKLTAILIGALCGVSIQARASELPAWQATRSTDMLTQQPVCLLESVTRTIDDGRTSTPMHLVFDGQSFVVITRSKLDLSYPQLGLQVDDLPVHTIDRVYKQTHAVFDKDADSIRKEFIKGHKVYIALGFWPTWPKSHTVVTPFSLLGFRAAYNEFQACQKQNPNTFQQK